jgi:class 3 adenylate cyclase/CHASE2 domain-containing sensor protein
MIRLWRNLTARTILLGISVTVLVMVLDDSTRLEAIERFCYDRRARYFQHFSPPPTNRLVHLDIDDAALETIGRWPWDRGTLADIVDEVRIAGAEALSLDLIFPELQKVEYVPLSTGNSAVGPATGPSAGPSIGSPPQPAGEAEAAGMLPATGSASAPSTGLASQPAGPGGVVVPAAEITGTFGVVNHDARLAEAMRRFGRVMVPVSFSLIPPPPVPPVQAAATAVFAGDLELPREAVAARVEGGTALSEELYVFARRDALARRIGAELDRDPCTADAMRARLMPNTRRTEDSSLTRQYAEVFRQVLATRAAARFTHDVPPACPPLIRASPEALPLPAYAEAAWVSGFVNYLPMSDGLIRAVPMWVNVDGRLYPQMDFVLACALLGADVRQVRIGRNELVIPAGDGRVVVVPVRNIESTTAGQVGTFFDIPWTGTSAWEYMYDFPHHRRAKQHLAAAEVWALAQSRRAMTTTRSEVARAIGLFADSGIDTAVKFRAAPPGPADVKAWAARANEVLKEAAPFAEPARKLAAWNQALNSAIGWARPFAEPVRMLASDTSSDDERAFLTAESTIVRGVHTVEEGTAKIDAKATDLQAILKGKVVLFGGTATALGDRVPTSLHGACPGVVVHGAVLNALLTARYWRQAPDWVTALITLGTGLVVTAAVVWLSPFAALGATLSIVGGYVAVNGLLLFDYGDWVVGLAGPLVAAAAVWGALTLSRYIAETRERRRITKQFQGYVDPALVNYLIAHPDVNLEGEVREMSVVFTDLAGYTSLTEKLGARAVKILGRYKTLMVPAIRNHRGLIHSFMGDGIMVSYGAPIPNPNHAADALSTILAIQGVMKTFNAEMAAEGHAPLVTRAGVCTGPAVVGNSGSDQGRDYACLGNTTNLAARLESANKAVGTTMMISARTAELLGGRFLLRPIAKLTVKGKTVPEMTYEPLALADEATDAHRRLAELTTAVFDAYVAGQFADCVAAADAMDAAVGPTRLPELYRDTCRGYLAAGGPPTGFLGQIVLKEK